MSIVARGITRLFPINADSKDLDIDVENYTIFKCESSFGKSRLVFFLI